ncbi:RidA family protein [Micromonospora sp. NPDC005163]
MISDIERGAKPRHDPTMRQAPVAGRVRVVFVSGQVPWAEAGKVPVDFESQCRLTWRNVLAVPAEAGWGWNTWPR